MNDMFDFKDFVISILRRYKTIIILMFIFAIIFGGYGYAFSGNQDVLDKNTETNIAYIFVKPKTIYNQQGDYIADKVVSDTISVIDSELFLKKSYQMFVSIATDEFLKKYNIDKNSFSFDNYKSLLSVQRLNNSPVLKVFVNKYDKEFADNLMRYYYVSLKSDLTKYNNDVELDFEGYRQMDGVSENTGNEGTYSKMIKYGILGLFVGFVFSILALMLYDVFDSKMRHKSDFKKYKLDILGIIESEK